MPGSNLAEPNTALTYTISQLAAEFGVTARTIRFYEDKKLLQPQRNGLARVYGRRDRGRLKLILRGKRLGFSLTDISEMLDLYDPHGEGREQLLVMLEKSRQRLAELEQQRTDIDDVIEELQKNCSLITLQLDNGSGA
ncbi:MAG: MerR family DNA-binding transcriptional regulator [Alphaproteobacteria bacterium]|jgi:DNA-binding transcriptional MerR regulator